MVRIRRDKLRELRQLAGLTQAALAEKAKISYAYVGHIESGRRETVSPQVFVRICDALGIAPNARLVLTES